MTTLYWLRLAFLAALLAAAALLAYVHLRGAAALEDAPAGGDGRAAP